MRVYPKLLIGVFLFLLTIIIYYPAVDSLMVADDFVKVGRLGWDDALRSLHDTAGSGRNEYRPVIHFSYALSNYFWSGEPEYYHWESILLHFLNVLLLFIWVFLLTRSTPISAMAATFFAIHPIHHERVVWITARDNLVSTLFVLIALVAYTLARHRENNKFTVSSSYSVRILVCLSVGSFLLSLLSYEGSVTAPFIVAALEFFFFANTERNFWRRVWTSAVRTRWYWIVLLMYLVWWALVFQGETGDYSPTRSLSGVLHNCYTLLYQLFHGNSRLAGIIYFGLFIAFFRMPRTYRSLAAFSAAFLFLAFIPFMISNGFASRFGYASAAGYVILLAIMIHTVRALPIFNKQNRVLFVSGYILPTMIFIGLAGYYGIALRSRIADWRTAGRIADTIPRQLKTLHSDLPDGAKLVISGIPRMYGHAYVYPSGLEYSIERFYPGRHFQIVSEASEMGRLPQKAEPDASNTFHFIYSQNGPGPGIITEQN